MDTVNTLIVMKLLTELNQKNNITMVMVTHDVGLKNFADRLVSCRKCEHFRIIWMRDGKIQRIEIVAKHKKQETLRYHSLYRINPQRKLNEDLEAVQTRQKRKTHGTETQYRTPSDYKTYAHYAKNAGVSEKQDQRSPPNGR